MKELVEVMAKSLVSNPSAVVVEATTMSEVACSCSDRQSPSFCEAMLFFFIFTVFAVFLCVIVKSIQKEHTQKADDRTDKRK